ncbi:MAG: AAA family ATPase [Clostridia bacterium]|nr:AAA family ATPase [Clostridia bacterium]
MNEEILYENGKDFLSKLIKRWLENCNDASNEGDFKLFLPKMNFVNSELIFEFPIYKVETDRCPIVGTITFNVTKNIVEKIESGVFGFFTGEITTFNLDAHQESIALIYKVLCLELNKERVKEYPEQLEKNIEDTQKNIDTYYETLKGISYKEFMMSQHSNDVDIQTNEPQKVEEETKVVEQAEVVEEKEKTDNDIAMELMEGNNSENVKYDFEWKSKFGLKYITDDALELAYMFIKRGAIELKTAVRDRKDKNGNPYKEKYVIIVSDIRSFCNYDDSTISSIKYQIEKEEKENLPSTVFTAKRGEYSIYNLNFDNVCFGCKFKACPKQLAGYVLYLKNNGKLEEALKERKEFRDKENVDNTIFRFKWEVEDGLKYVDEKIYNYAEELVRRKIVFVETVLSEDKWVKIRSTLGCKDFKLMNADIEQLPAKEEYEASRGNLVRKPKMKFGFCNAYTCLLNSCPYEVAGYIYYLRTSGREKEIEEDRKYYAENKEKIEKIILENKQKELDRIANKKNDILDKFGEFKNSISNLKNLVDDLANKQLSNLHCFIQSDDEVERNKFVDKIYNELKNSEKIVKTRNMSLQNFMAMNVHFSGGEYKDKDGNLLRDRKGVGYIADHQVRYTLVEEKTLYILDNVTEFINDYNVYKRIVPDYASGELKKKQFEHVIRLLTSISDSYIIILGTEKEKDALLGLDARLQYIYNNSVYVIPGLSIDEMFELYKTNIKAELLNEFRTNEENYKKQFSDYVSLNKAFIPFSDRELVDYLTMYTNSKDGIEFPENVYKKETIDEALKNIIGLQSVKDKLKEFEKYMLFQVKAKANDMKLKSSNMHMIFTGNPGTGKTTFARIMAKMLYDLGMLKENKLIEVEKKDLIASYIGQTAPKTAEVIEKAIGGVLFIDEAYSLTEGKDSFGKEAIATLIKAMEDRKDELVVIFAGYKDEMKTFMDSNAGITSRIGYTFDFPDYTPEELVQIFNVKMKNMGFEIEEGVEPQIENICEYFSKRKSFGNGRFIDKLTQEMIIKHSTHDNVDIRKITTEDIPSMEQLTNSSNTSDKSALEEQLKNIVGMQAVKDKLVNFEKYVSFNKKAVTAGLDIPNSNMHMIFTGNPGTGKTTIARIVAKMLFDIGVIYENKLVEVERKDLVAEYTGQTAPKTTDVIEKAMGGVLFIDEAYTLAEGKDSFGKEAIATLIKAMEDHKGEFIVIFAGYRDEMKTFTDMNPGIASRIGYTFEFPDYTPDELLEIFKRKISKIGFELSNDIEKEVLNICEYFSKRKAFGNGRFVDKLIQETIMKHTMNESENIKLITLQDIPSIVELNPNRKDLNYDAQELLNKIVGMKDLKDKIAEFTEYIKFVKDAQNAGINIPNQNMHMIFTGNPGTGKTTVARVMAKLLFDMGFIHENKLVEVERKDLVAGYVGQTAPKTNEVIEKAMGGVLFIDEAYTLAQGRRSGNDYGAEAIATLIKAMEDHKGEFIAIFAGYKDEMRDFLDINPGIASRIGYTFDFPDYSAAELEEIFYRKIEDLGFKVDEEAKKNVHDVMQYFESVENIGNGRFADKVVQNTLLKMAKNRAENLAMVMPQHIPTINEMTATLLGGKDMIDPTKISEESLRKTAAHETGHATIAYLLNKKPGIKKITVKAEGRGSLGYVDFSNRDENVIYRKSYMLNKIKELMAGMVAEDVFFGEHANGNTSDLERATAYAYNMVTKYGMSDLGYVQIKKPEGEVAKMVFEEQNRILKQCYDETYELIKQNKSKMDNVVEYLLIHGDMTEEEFIREFEK